MEETTGFEREQFVLSLIPLIIFIYFGLYLLGISIFLFILCLWEENEDASPWDLEPPVAGFEDPEIEIDESLFYQRLKDIAKVNVDKVRNIKFLINSKKLPVKLKLMKRKKQKLTSDFFFRNKEVLLKRMVLKRKAKIKKKARIVFLSNKKQGIF